MSTKSLPGTALSEAEFSGGKVLVTRWPFRAHYAWDAGQAVGRYLAGLKEGYLTGVACHRCRRTVVPPRVFCEVCFGAMDSYVRLPDTGTVNTFSLCYVTWDMKRLERPQIPAVIEIDGTRPRSGILHLIEEVQPEKVAVGMKVRAVWKPASEREGAITDIRYFRPLEKG